MREKGPIDRPKSQWVDVSPKGARLRTTCCTAVATATPHCAASEGEIVRADKQKPRWKCKPVRSVVVRLCPQRQRENTQSPKSVPLFAASLGFQLGEQLLVDAAVFSAEDLVPVD